VRRREVIALLVRRPVTEEKAAINTQLVLHPQVLQVAAVQHHHAQSRSMTRLFRRSLHWGGLFLHGQNELSGSGMGKTKRGFCVVPSDLFKGRNFLGNLGDTALSAGELPEWVSLVDVPACSSLLHSCYNEFVANCLCRGRILRSLRNSKATQPATREREMQTKTVLLAGCIALVGLPVNAAEKVSGVNSDLQVVSEVNAAIPDKPGHTFKQLAVTWKASGSSELANFWASAVEQQDNVGGDTKSKGYGTGHLANGELAYFSWEGTTKAVPKEGGAFELTGSGTFTWLGGTGKYQKISGGGTYTCKGDQKGVQCPWEGEPQY
jgi:hypothetical protein